MKRFLKFKSWKRDNLFLRSNLKSNSEASPIVDEFSGGMDSFLPDLGILINKKYQLLNVLDQPYVMFGIFCKHPYRGSNFEKDQPICRLSPLASFFLVFTLVVFFYERDFITFS